MPWSNFDTILTTVSLLTGTGVVITAKDFYKLKDELDKRYVLKEVHNSEIIALKEDIEAITRTQKDVQSIVTKIYDFLLENNRRDN
jgi:hypothetical protein